MKKILIFLSYLFLIACENQNADINNRNQEQVENESKEFEVIGTYHDSGLIYRSIYTNEDLLNIAILYQKKMSMESSKSDYVILFYNDKDKTPSTQDLEVIDKRVNKSLIGGIRKQQGRYYLLNVNSEHQLVIGEELIEIL